MQNKKTFITIYIILTIMAVIMACGAWVNASFSLCGLSGCTVGGLGVSHDPQRTLWLVVLSGIIASFPAFIAGLHLKSLVWYIIGFTLLITMPLIGSLIIGVDLSGYPTRYPRVSQ